MKNPFSIWKIYIILIISIGISTYLLYSSLNEVHFIKVEIGKGTHIFIDKNKDGKVNLNDINEFIISEKGNYRKKTNNEYLSEIKWSKTAIYFILLAIVFMCFRDLAYMWRIKLLTKNSLTWKRSFWVIFLWEFASALSPGIVGGAAVAMFILKKEGINLGKSTSIVVITALMDNLFYVLLIPVLFIFIDSNSLFPNNFSYEKSVQFIFWLAYIIILVISLILIICIFFVPELIKKILLLFFKLPFLNKWINSANNTANDIISTSKEFKKEKFYFWIKPFIATIWSWTSRYLVINCILAAFIKINGIKHVLILAKQVVMWIFLLISPTPGATGIAEFAFSELMQDLSSSIFLIVSLAILWRMISYFPYLLIGSILLPFWLKKNNNEK